MNRKQTLLKLFRLSSQYRGAYVILLITALIQTGGTLLLIMLNGRAIDRMVTASDWRYELILICLQSAGISLLTALCQYLMQRACHRLTNSTMRQLREALFAKLDRLPVGTVDRSGKGKLVNYFLADAEQLSDGILQGLMVFVSGILMVAGTMAFMLWQNLWIGLFIVAMTPFSVLIVSFISKRTYRTYRQVAALRADLSVLSKELQQQEVLVVTYGYQQKAIERFERINNELAVAGLWGQFYASLPNPSTRLLNNMIFCVVGMLSAFRALAGDLTVGEVSNFLAYVRQYTKPFNEVTNVIAQFQTAIVSTARIFDFLELPEREQYPLKQIMEKQASMKKPAGEYSACRTDEAVVSSSSIIDFRNIRFSYQPGQPVLQDITFSIRPGEKIALIGKTGCGKTTLVQLLLRYFAPEAGEIRLFDRLLTDYSDDELFGRIGMVPQDIWIFHGTVLDNLRYGSPQADMEAVIQAAKQAFLHDTIRHLPLGYETIISPEQSVLSNGQLQLLCIARLLLLDPDLVILDEATSNIDTLTEVYIQRALFRLMKNKTAIIIAHRLSTIRDCDRIFRMEAGRIVSEESE